MYTMRRNSNSGVLGVPYWEGFVNVQIIVRLFAALGMCLAAAWLGGRLTGSDLWGFVEAYKMPYYVGVAATGYFVVNPALKARQAAE